MSDPEQEILTICPKCKKWFVIPTHGDYRCHYCDNPLLYPFELEEEQQKEFASFLETKEYIQKDVFQFNYKKFWYNSLKFDTNFMSIFFFLPSIFVFFVVITVYGVDVYLNSDNPILITRGVGVLIVPIYSIFSLNLSFNFIAILVAIGINLEPSKLSAHTTIVISTISSFQTRGTVWG